LCSRPIQKIVIGGILSFGMIGYTHAAVLSIDWQTSGENLIIRDTNSGLEWLDLTETNNVSRQNILPQLQVGGSLEGWRYANNAEVVALWANFSNDLSTSRIINGLDPSVATASSFLGNIFCEASCGSWPYGVSGLTSNFFEVGSTPNYSVVGANKDIGLGQTRYYGNDDAFGHPRTASAIWFGLYLVRPVPIPAAVWLFGSGLISLIGLGRRKSSVSK